MNFSFFSSPHLSAENSKECNAFAGSISDKVKEDKALHQKKKELLSPFKTEVTVTSSEAAVDFRKQITRSTIANYRAFAENPNNKDKIVMKAQGAIIEGGIPLSVDKNGMAVMRTEKGVSFLDQEKKAIAADFFAALEEEQRSKDVTFNYSPAKRNVLSKEGLSQKDILDILRTEKEITDDLGEDTWRDVEGESNEVSANNDDTTDVDTEGEMRCSVSETESYYSKESTPSTPLSSPARSRAVSFSTDIEVS